jgi:hypothetical protein
MDLASHGRVDLAERLLARYALVSGDYDLYALVDFYESSRAYVRGKIATILPGDARASDEPRRRAALEARRYFLLALATHRRAVLPPLLVCVGGVIASGKSTVLARFEPFTELAPHERLVVDTSGPSKGRSRGSAASYRCGRAASWCEAQVSREAARLARRAAGLTRVAGRTTLGTALA